MAKPGRLLLTTDTVGGVWTFSLNLARALTKSGCQVLLAVMGRAASPAQRAEVQGISGLHLRELDCKLEWEDEPWSDVFRAGEWLLSLEASFRPDVVHLNSYSFAALPWRAATLITAHSCVLSWWRAVFGASAPAKYSQYRRAVAEGLRAADLVVAPTRAMLDDLERDYGPLRSTVVANGVVSDNFEPGRKLPLILAAGRWWDIAKNGSAVDGLAARASWPTVMLGDGASVSAALCLGQVDSRTVSRLLSSAGIFVHPARYEPFGLAVLEAALSGCALVLADIPALRENWDGCARFVAPEDRAGLYDAVETLIASTETRSKLASAARHRGSSFSLERMQKGYLEAYDTAQRTRSSRACERLLGPLEVVTCA